MARKSGRLAGITRAALSAVRIAEPEVRIHFSPAESPQTFGSAQARGESRWPPFADLGTQGRAVERLGGDWEVPAGTPVAVSPMGGPEGMWTGNQPQVSSRSKPLDL